MGTHIFPAEGVSDLGYDQVRVRHVGQRDPEDAILEATHELGRNRQSQARLADPARARDGSQSSTTIDEPDHRCDIRPTTDEPAWRNWQIRRIHRPEWRKCGVANLK